MIQRSAPACWPSANDIGQAAYDGEAVAGAFLRLLDSLTGSPEGWPQPWAGWRAAMAYPHRAARSRRWRSWWMLAWLQGGGRRHGQHQRDTARMGPAALLDDFPPLPARRHRPGTAATPQATQPWDPALAALKPLAMARAELVRPGTPSRCRCGSTRWLVASGRKQSRARIQKFIRKPAWCGSNGNRATAKERPCAPAMRPLQLWIAPTGATPLLCRSDAAGCALRRRPPDRAQQSRPG